MELWAEITWDKEACSRCQVMAVIAVTIKTEVTIILPWWVGIMVGFDHWYQLVVHPLLLPNSVSLVAKYRVNQVNCVSSLVVAVGATRWSASMHVPSNSLIR